MPLGFGLGWRVGSAMVRGLCAGGRRTGGRAGSANIRGAPALLLRTVPFVRGGFIPGSHLAMSCFPLPFVFSQTPLLAYCYLCCYGSVHAALLLHRVSMLSDSL